MEEGLWRNESAHCADKEDVGNEGDTALATRAMMMGRNISAEDIRCAAHLTPVQPLAFKEDGRNLVNRQGVGGMLGRLEVGQWRGRM